MTLTGSQIAFSGSDENGVASTEFNSWFPKSFDLSRVSSSNCTDLAWPILVLLCIALFGLAWFRNASGLYILFVLNGCGYWYVVLIGQPMSTNYKDIVANGLAEFSIVLCATYAFYQMTARHTFVHWRVFTRKKRCIFWLVYLTPYLIGIHLNVIAYLPWLVSSYWINFNPLIRNSCRTLILVDTTTDLSRPMWERSSSLSLAASSDSPL